MSIDNWFVPINNKNVDNLCCILLQNLNMHNCYDSFINFITNYDENKNQLSKLLFDGQNGDQSIVDIVTTSINPIYIIKNQYLTTIFVKNITCSKNIFTVLCIGNSQSVEEQVKSVDILKSDKYYPDVEVYLEEIKNYLSNIGPKCAYKVN